MLNGFFQIKWKMIYYFAKLKFPTDISHKNGTINVWNKCMCPYPRLGTLTQQLAFPPDIESLCNI